MKVYRVIEYNIPDGDEAAARWLKATLDRSIDGQYQLGFGVIRAMRIDSSMDLDVTQPDLDQLFSRAEVRPWSPPRTKVAY